LFVRENGINALVETLRHYQEDAQVVSKCCSTLWNVLQTDRNSLKRVERMMGLHIICDVWKLHEPNPNVVAAAAGLVGQLLQQSMSLVVLGSGCVGLLLGAYHRGLDTVKCEFMLERRGTELVISAIKKHFEQAHAVCACLSVLAALCTPPRGLDVKGDRTLTTIDTH
jgi:hypothetical protein